MEANDTAAELERLFGAPQTDRLKQFLSATAN